MYFKVLYFSLICLCSVDARLLRLNKPVTSQSKTNAYLPRRKIEVTCINRPILFRYICLVDVI